LAPTNPVVEGLNRELLDRPGHCLANFIVIQKLPHRVNLEVGHRQRFRRLDVLDHGAGNPFLSNASQSFVPCFASKSFVCAARLAASLPLRATAITTP
jgi:hypothetical protein